MALFTLVLDGSQLYNDLNILRGIKLPHAPLSILNLTSKTGQWLLYVHQSVLSGVKERWKSHRT